MYRGFLYCKYQAMENPNFKIFRLKKFQRKETVNFISGTRIFLTFTHSMHGIYRIFFNQSSILHNILIFYNRDLRLLSKGKNTFFQNIFNSRFSDCVVSVSQNYTDLMNIYRLIILVESSKLCAILPRPQAACYILEIESIRKNYLK